MPQAPSEAEGSRQGPELCVCSDQSRQHGAEELEMEVQREKALV